MRKDLCPYFSGDVIQRRRVVVINAVLGVQSLSSSAVDGVMSVLAAHRVFDVMRADNLCAFWGCACGT